MNFLNQVVLADAASGNAFGTYGMILIWVLVFAAMYFFILRPSSKKKKEEADSAPEVIEVTDVEIVEKPKDDDAALH